MSKYSMVVGSCFRRNDQRQYCQLILEIVRGETIHVNMTSWSLKVVGKEKIRVGMISWYLKIVRGEIIQVSMTGWLLKVVGIFASVWSVDIWKLLHKKWSTSVCHILSVSCDSVSPKLQFYMISQRWIFVLLTYSQVSGLQKGTRGIFINWNPQC